ncbi:MAG: tetratricopeptide repeat protein, partial [Alphaproteobacteria bacterium]
MAQDPAAPDRRALGPGWLTGPAGRFLHEALKEYEGGRYAHAEAILRQVVEQRPGNGWAWHLRGLTASRAGDTIRAVDCFVRAVACDTSNARYCAALADSLVRLGRDDDAVAPWRRAIDLDPENAAWQAGMARCLSRLDRHDEALPCFRAALRLSPGDASLHAAFGYALQRRGNAAEAAGQYRNALRADPDRDEVRLNLAAALRELGDDEAAAAECREVLRHNPRSVPALNNLGSALCHLGRIEEAVRRLEAAMLLEPENLTTLNNLGVALDAAGAAAEAEACLRKALALRPDFPDAHRSLANLLRGSGRLDEAALHYRAVIERLPLDFRSYGNLGLVLLNLNRPHDAVAVYEKALALQPGRPDIRTSLGIAQLLIGDFENGWTNYDARWHGDRAPAWRPGHGAVRWRGENRSDDPAGGTPTILVHAEQGFGDTLQFCRYLPLVSATGAHVVFECQPPLAELMATLPKATPAQDIRIIARGEPAPAAGYHAPLLSLPGIFGTKLDTIPA